MSTLFVDESKSVGYTMVATLVADADVARLRRDVRSLVLPGQRRLHFAKEQDGRRRLVLSKLVTLGFSAHVVQSTPASESSARRACLIALVGIAADHACTGIVLERDESIEASDRRILFAAIRDRHADLLAYRSEPAHGEPLLWVSDAIAWSIQKAGDWRRRVEPMIADVTRTP